METPRKKERDWAVFSILTANRCFLFFFNAGRSGFFFFFFFFPVMTEYLYSARFTHSNINVHFRIQHREHLTQPYPRGFSPVKVNPCCQKQYGSKCNDPSIHYLTLSRLTVWASQVSWGGWHSHVHAYVYIHIYVCSLMYGCAWTVLASVLSQTVIELMKRCFHLDKVVLAFKRTVQKPPQCHVKLYCITYFWLFGHLGSS